MTDSSSTGGDGQPPSTGIGAEGWTEGAGDGHRPGITGPAAAMTAEWPKKAVDAVDLVVNTIHDRAIRPVVLAARVVVFGVLAAVLSLVVLVLVTIGLVRLLDVYAFGGRVWISDAVLGGLFTLAGLFAWSRRTARGPAAKDG
jgi:hypothetical protein